MNRSPQTIRDVVREAGRREVLQVVEDLVLEGGIANVTMQYVARRVRCGVGTLYHYFPSREAMLNELAETRLRAPLTQAAAAQDRGGEPVERLRIYLEHCARWAHANARLIKALGMNCGSGGCNAAWCPNLHRMLCAPGSTLCQIMELLVAEIAAGDAVDLHLARSMAAAIAATLIGVCATQRCGRHSSKHVLLARRAILAAAGRGWPRPESVGTVRENQGDSADGAKP